MNEPAAPDPGEPSALAGRDALSDAIDSDLEDPFTASAARPLRSRHEHDPWAHRRGEPRLFAFLWTIYLLIAVGGSLLWLSRSTVISTSTYGPAARIMLLVVAAGATVLWPMVRLSQASPRGSAVRAALADVVVVLFPMQMILWPLVMLAQWPLGIVGALALMCTLWVLLTGGLIAIGTSGGRAARAPSSRDLFVRAIWMAVCITIVSAAPTAALARRALSGPEAQVAAWVPMLSPFTAVPALTGQGFSGPQHPVSSTQWQGLSAIALPAAIAWALAILRRRARPGGPNRETGPGGGGVEPLSGLD